MESHFGLPMKLADYLAQALDLPGLFLGTYNNTTIEYMHLTHSISAWGATQNQCFVFKSNHGLYGMEIAAGRNVSSLVQLDKDPVFDLLKAYRNFPNGETDDNSKSRLFSTFMFPGGIIDHVIQKPGQAGDPSTNLYTRHHGLLMDIDLQRGRKDRIITPPVEPGDLPGETTAGFVDRYRHLVSFEQSGLFGQAAAPHDTDYLLFIYRASPEQTCICLQTKRYFRVICRGSDPSESRWIIEAEIAEIDWKHLILEAARQQHPIHKSTPEHLYIRFFDKDTNHAYVLDSPTVFLHNEASLKLWQVLQHLIAQFLES